MISWVDMQKKILKVAKTLIKNIKCFSLSRNASAVFFFLLCFTKFLSRHIYLISKYQLQMFEMWIIMNKVVECIHLREVNYRIIKKIRTRKDSPCLDGVYYLKNQGFIIFHFTALAFFGTQLFMLISSTMYSIFIYHSTRYYCNF